VHLNLRYEAKSYRKQSVANVDNDNENYPLKVIVGDHITLANTGNDFDNIIHALEVLLREELAIYVELLDPSYFERIVLENINQVPTAADPVPQNHQEHEGFEDDHEKGIVFKVDLEFLIELHHATHSAHPKQP
jgi:hypothetical protein